MKRKIRELKKNFHSGTLSFDGFILTFVKVVTIMVSLITTMFLSRMLSLKEYGTYSQLLIIINIVSIIAGMGLNNAVNYFYNKYDNQKNEYIGNIFSVTIIVGLFFGILIILLRNNISNFYNNQEIVPLIIYIAFKPVLDNIISIFQPLYISLKKSKNIAKINIFMSVLKVVLIVLSYVIFEKISYIFIAQLILDMVQILVLFLNIKTNMKNIKIEINKSIIIRLLKYALPLTIALMSGIIFKESDKIIISNLSTVEDLAIYSNMSKQLPFEFVVTSFTAVVTPILVKHIKNNKNKAIFLWKNYFQFSYIISWLLNFGALVCAKEMLIFLYSQKYLIGLNIFIIYLVTELFRFTYFGLILSASGNTKFITISSLISVFLNIILNIILYMFMGTVGPAIATLITVIVMNTMQFLFSLKTLNVKCTDIIKFKEMFYYIIQLVVVGIIFYIIKILLYRIVNNYIIVLIITYVLYVVINLFISRRKLFLLIKEMK